MKERNKESELAVVSLMLYKLWIRDQIISEVENFAEEQPSWSRLYSLWVWARQEVPKFAFCQRLFLLFPVLAHYPLVGRQLLWLFSHSRDPQWVWNSYDHAPREGCYICLVAPSSILFSLAKISFVHGFMRFCGVNYEWIIVIQL